MVNIFLIRHGKASSGWDSLNPDLNGIGRQQSLEVSKRLYDRSLKSFDVFSSPLLRCKQTAKPFCDLSKQKLNIDQRLSEIPSPIKDLTERVLWLKRVLPLTWKQLENDSDSLSSGINYSLWRSDIFDFLKSLKKDTYIFTHFVVINSIVGSIKNNNKVVNFNADNTSITRLNHKDGAIKIISLGEESITKIN